MRKLYNDLSVQGRFERSFDSEAGTALQCVTINISLIAASLAPSQLSVNTGFDLDS